MNGRKDYFHEWATYEGDKRALSSTFKYLVKVKEEFASSKDDLIMVIAKNVSIKFAHKISNHYAN